MTRRVLKRRAGSPTKTKPQSKVQLRQEFVSLENTEMVEPFLDQKRKIVVKLEHPVQEVVAVVTSPSGYAVEAEAGDRCVFIDWEQMQSLPNREPLVVEYYQTISFDAAEVWKKVKALILETANASTTKHEVVVEFLLRKMKTRWPSVFWKVAGEKL